MRRRPQSTDHLAIPVRKPLSLGEKPIGLVLSGGGVRACYQIGALRALIPYLPKTGSPFSVIIGSSIGAINGLMLGAGLKKGLATAVDEVTEIWQERQFGNTFAGSPSKTFFRAIKLATIQYVSPGPNPTDESIFDPAPLMTRIDETIERLGGLGPDERDPGISAIAVMTTLEGLERKPMLFVSTHKPMAPELLAGATFEVCYREKLSAKHGFASAALPAVLPPVELDTEHGLVKFVDGGISQNIPVDPAIRLGASKIITIDISGRLWWHDRFGEAHDTRPTWEIAAKDDTYCMMPPELFMIRPEFSMGKILKEALGNSTTARIKTLGPVWPIFKLLEKKLGSEVAYETVSYVALSKDYIHNLMETGLRDTERLLRNKDRIEFHTPDEKELV